MIRNLAYHSHGAIKISFVHVRQRQLLISSSFALSELRILQQLQSAFSIPSAFHLPRYDSHRQCPISGLLQTACNRDRSC